MTGRGIGHLYLCTPDRPDLEEFLEAVIEGGVDTVQLRDKDADARTIARRASVAVEVCRRHGVPFVLNDRPDLALGIGADGVHVGQDDAPVELCRRLLGDEAIVGLSTHAPAELDAAISERVSYLSAGPVEPTPTKPGRAGTGLDYVTYATSRSPVPVCITGGVSTSSIAALAAAGARHFVVVRALTQASDPYAAAKALRSAIDAAISPPSI